jgi:hypothetical protein
MPIVEVSRIAASAGRALVPVVPTLRWSPLPHQRRSRADPSFVTQLIATAELIPQTGAASYSMISSARCRDRGREAQRLGRLETRSSLLG